MYKPILVCAARSSSPSMPHRYQHPDRRLLLFFVVFVQMMVVLPVSLPLPSPSPVSVSLPLFPHPCVLIL